MNYYILPKNNVTLHINTTFIAKNRIEPYLSYSLKHFFHKIEEQIKEIELSGFQEIQKVVNTYEFIFSSIPYYFSSVSKVKPDSNIFYELIEIFHTCNLEDLFSYKNKITTLHVTPNYSSSVFFINVVREDKEDEIEYSNFSHLNQEILKDKKIDFLFFEFDKEEYSDITRYSRNIVLGLLYIIKYQMLGGITIFKIDHIFYKIIIDVMYILSNLFEKVYIFKPNVSDITKAERYLVCKFFNPGSDISLQELEEKLNELFSFTREKKEQKEQTIYSILTNTIPSYFINKIEESNIVIGQQQLESLSLIINLIKNKNKEDKIETIKRNHIQKCIQWCEKYKIPHNKFTDKTNIFLNNKIVKDTNNMEEEEDIECEIV